MRRVTAVVALRRLATGSCNTRRLRRDHFVPATLTISGCEINVVCRRELVWLLLSEQPRNNQVFEVLLRRKRHTAILAETQRQSVSAVALHLSFVAIDPRKAVELSVPLKVVCSSKRQSDQWVRFNRRSVKIVCLPTEVPSCILVNLGERHHSAKVAALDLVLPAGVKLATEEQKKNNVMLMLVTPKRQDADLTSGMQLKAKQLDSGG